MQRAERREQYADDRVAAPMMRQLVPKYVFQLFIPQGNERPQRQKEDARKYHGGRAAGIDAGKVNFAANAKFRLRLRQKRVQALRRFRRVPPDRTPKRNVGNDHPAADGGGARQIDDQRDRPPAHAALGGRFRPHGRRRFRRVRGGRLYVRRWRSRFLTNQDLGRACLHLRRQRKEPHAALQRDGQQQPRDQHKPEYIL